MVPTSTRSGSLWPWRRRWVSSRSTRPLASSNSSTAAIIGNISLSSRPPAARSSARIWLRSRPGRSRPRRIARQPSAGFSSSLVAHIGQHLVAADIEGAEGHRLVAGGVEHGAIERELLGGARQRRRHHELQLGAEQPDAGGAGFLDMRQVDREAGIEQQRDRLAVLGHAGLVAQREVLQLPARAQPHALDIGRFHVGRRPHVHVAGRAVDDDRRRPDRRGRWHWRSRRPPRCRARARRSRRASSGRLPPARGRAGACGRSRAAPPAPWCARRSPRSPAGGRAAARSPGRAAGASAGSASSSRSCRRSRR